MPPAVQSAMNYRSLANLRYEIRRFLSFSEQAARAAGLEPQQHQALLAVKGLPAGLRPTIGVLAERLQLQHHTTVELAGRLAAKGLLRRRRAAADRREVLLTLTPRGEEILRQLSLTHRAELRSAGAILLRALKEVIQDDQFSRRPLALRRGRRHLKGKRNPS